MPPAKDRPNLTRSIYVCPQFCIVNNYTHSASECPYEMTYMTCSGGSRSSTIGGPYHVADPDIRRLGGANLTCFPVSHVYFFAGGEPKSITKLYWGTMARFAPLLLDPPLITCLVTDW